MRMNVKMQNSINLLVDKVQNSPVFKSSIKICQIKMHHVELLNGIWYINMQTALIEPYLQTTEPDNAKRKAVVLLHFA
jgi:hypothetical protein